MRAILRIMVFSVGGLLTVAGIFLLFGLFVQIRGDREDLMGSAVIATLVLLAGVGICASAPRRLQLPASAQMLSREEKAIQNIREHREKRKLRIGVFAAFFMAMLFCSVFTWWQTRRLDAMVTPEYFRSTGSLNDTNEGFPILLSTVYTLAGARAKLLYHAYWFAAWTGFFIALLIIELVGLTRPELTLAMWERIQRLEKEIQDLQKRG